MVEADILKKNFQPMIALVNSNGVYDICGKNSLNFADMLHPYTKIFSTIRDPTNISVSSKLKIDIRDIAQNGFLLTLTVLPSVLDQAVALAANNGNASGTSKAFLETLNYWQEPSEHEFLDSYIACIFAVSAHEKDPMGELANLINQQRLQQHSTVENSDSLSFPGHCTSPKWFMSNILKFYVLIQDVSLGNTDGVENIYKQMVTTYGTNNCHLLRINSSKDGVCTPDLWSAFIDKRDTILELGLELARTKISEMKQTTSKTDVGNDIQMKSLSTVSVTNSSANPRIADDYLAYLSATTGASPPISSPMPNNYIKKKIFRGGYLDASDRERLNGFIEDFTINALIPFVERQLKVLNDGWVNRKGFAKSLTLGMKKWFGPVTNTNITPSKVTYSLECGELQSRRLADLCVLFGLYSYALPVYQSLKKDFEHDNSWLHYAGTLEMAAICSSITNAKDYPKHYMDNALTHYTLSSHKPLLALRTGLESYEILTKMKCYDEAANQMLKLANFNFGNDLYPAVLNEKAGEAFNLAKMYRKMCFQYVLTGYRYNKCGQKRMALDCYRKALPELLDKNWHFADDHVLHTLANDLSDMGFALECASNLVRENSGKSEEEQESFLSNYIKLLHDNNITMPQFKYPIVRKREIKIIYGNIPNNCDNVYNCENDNKKCSWLELEKAAFYTLFNKKDSFKEVKILSDDKTKNNTINETPQGEKCRIRFYLENPLTIKLTMKNVKLGFQYIKLINNEIGTENDLENYVISEIVLESSSERNRYTRIVELYYIPNANISEVSIDKIVFDLHSGENIITCFIPIEARGQKIARKYDDKLESEYKKDYRMKMTVSKNVWPTIDVNLFKNNENSTSIASYCNQIFQISTDIENLGIIDIESICVTTNYPNLISVSENINGIWKLCDSHLHSTNEDVLVYSIDNNGELLKVNEKCQVKFSFKAPSIPLKGETVSLMIYCKAVNGTTRYKRFQLSFTTQHLLKIKTRLIDPFIGLCAVDFKNASDSKDSVLVKVEILRMKTLFTSSPILKINTNGKIVNVKESLIKNSLDGEVLMNPVKNRQISIDNAQSDTFPFYLKYINKNDDKENYDSTWWLGQALNEFPSFSNYLNKHTFLNPEQKEVYSFINPRVFENLKFIDYFAHLNIFALWKASIFNADGSFSTIFGESNIINPYLQYNPSPTAIQEIFLPPQLSQYRIPNMSPETLFIHSNTDSLQLKQAITEDQFVNATEMKSIDLWTNPVIVEQSLEAVELSEAASAIKANIYFDTNIIEHNFALNRICTVPVNIKISNYDRRCRPINVTIICTSSIPKINALFERHHNQQFINNPIIPHSHLICNMSKITKLIPANETHTLTFQLKTALPSVFDTSCLSISVSFKNSQNSVQLKLPSHHISILDISLKNFISPNGSRGSSVV